MDDSDSSHKKEKKDHSRKSSHKKKHKRSKRKLQDPSETPKHSRNEESGDKVEETSDVPESSRDEESSDSSSEYILKAKKRKTSSKPPFSVETETVSEETTLHPDPKKILLSISRKTSFKDKPDHSVKQKKSGNRSKSSGCKVKSETVFNVELPYDLFGDDQEHLRFMHSRISGSSESLESSAPGPSKVDQTDSTQERLPILKIVKSDQNEYKLMPKPRDPLPKETSSDPDQTGIKIGGACSSKSGLDKEVSSHFTEQKDTKITTKKVSSRPPYEKAHSYAYVDINPPKKTPESLSRESRHKKAVHERFAGEKQKIPAKTTKPEHSSKTSSRPDKAMNDYVKKEIKRLLGRAVLENACDSDSEEAVKKNFRKSLTFWPLGNIIAMFPGKDGCTRVVSLKTVCGEIVHPVQRLYPLELDNDGTINVPDKDQIAFDKDVL
ncbi:hypothetical protein TNIN_93391 [Trichonephila inaurata madagascariensis]|uniref:DUF5641 domain-containing protein n=1 Tax=Trichonephila inaurata madagascariensis TaxID=2747483 RepID=A0A8X6WZP3_9ARAC|nr:hypothetical protein TNIN_93391 [Trichonephila inaurata madagascariensis]